MILIFVKLASELASSSEEKKIDASRSKIAFTLCMAAMFYALASIMDYLAELMSIATNGFKYN